MPVSSLEEADEPGEQSSRATAVRVGPQVSGWVLEYLVSLTCR